VNRKKRKMQSLQLNTNPGRAAVLGLGADQLEIAIQNLSKSNFLVFQKMELGLDIGDHHKEWWSRLKTGVDTCEMAPRDHGKSLSLARAYPIWKLKYDPWCQEVLILGADLPSAVENLDKIKELLLSQPTLSYLVPTDWRDGFNSRSEIRLRNGKIARVKGIGSPLRGRHPQLIILDDVLNERNSASEENRRAMKQYFWEVVYPMKDKGTRLKKQQGFSSQIVTIGTAQHRDDLYHELQTNSAFKGAKLRAIIDEETKQVLWPIRYDYDSLVAIRTAMSSLFFSKEYQNEPLTEETSIFPPSLFEPIKDKNLSYVNSYQGSNPVYMGADFSVPGSTDGDYTVIYVMEWDQENKTFTPLNYWRAKPLKVQEQFHQIELYCEMFGVTMGFLEANMFQKIYSEHFGLNSTLPLRGNVVHHAAKASVEVGVLSFRPQFENGRWRFPYKTDQDKAKTDLMITEFNGITQKQGKIGNESFHDDIVMAMWHALGASKTTAFSVSWD